MNIVFFGSGKFGLPILKKLNEVFDVKAVLTREDKPAGRGGKITPTPIGQLSQDLGLRIIKYKKLDADFLKINLEILNVDLFVVVSFGEIIPKQFLTLPKFGAVNIHPSLLPKYRGASPMQSAILNGDDKTGFTIMLLDEKLDHGPILFTKEILLSKKDTYESLSKKLSLLAASLLPKVLEDFINKKILPKLQNDAIATYCNQIKKEDGYFSIDNLPPPEKLNRMMRAYYPWPGVWTRFKGKIVKFLPSGFVQMEGKNKIKIKDFLNGYPDFPLLEALF